MYTVKLCCEELGHTSRPLTAKNWLSILLSESSAKHLAIQFPLATFAKDSQTFAFFRTLGGKWAWLIMKTCKDRKFYTY